MLDSDLTDHDEPRTFRLTLRTLGMVLAVVSALLAGCAGASTPYNAKQACDIVGGIYTADGRCLAGNM